MGTNVKIQGFEWILETGAIDIITLCNHLCVISKNGGFQSGEDFLHLYMIKEKELYLGVFIKVNNMESYCLWKQNSNNMFELSSKEIEEGSNMADFNFFIFNPKYNKGLYQYYHRSSTLNNFSLFCGRRYKEHQKDLINKEYLGIDKNLTSSQIAKRKKEIRNKYKGSFKYSTILKPESFKKYVSELKEIKSIVFEASSVDVTENSGIIPLNQYANKISHKYHFRDKGVIHPVKDYIVKKAEEEFFNRATVTGIDPEDKEQVYKLFNNVEVFDKYDFNDVAKFIKFDTSKIDQSLKESKLIKLLKKVYAKPAINAIMKV